MYLAVLRRNHLELRCADDNFVNIRQCTQISRDHRPQWRKIFWSGCLDGTFIALALSSGKVFLFDSELNVTKRLDPSSSGGIEQSVGKRVVNKKIETESGARKNSNFLYGHPLL